MSWAAVGAGGLILIGWVLTARVLLTQSKELGELRERIAFLEAKVNGLKS
jgi:hypothetical protein